MDSAVRYLMLADLVLGVHVLIIAFVVGGQILVITGGVAGWPWVRSPWFRLAHLVAITIVAVQAWLGRVCPLTALEMTLRSKAGAAVYSGSFVAHWLQSAIYFEAPLWLFAVCYTVFGLLVVGTWFTVRPFPFSRKQSPK